MGVRYLNGLVTWLDQTFKYRTFWTINRLFSVRFSDHIPIPDHLTTRHKPTIWKPYYSGIQMVTVLCYSDLLCVPGRMKASLRTSGSSWHSSSSDSGVNGGCIILVWQSCNKMINNLILRFKLYKNRQFSIHSRVSLRRGPQMKRL